jgi:hypothetical protein
LRKLEKAAMRLRHKAALAALETTEPDECWQLLGAIVAPGREMQAVSERRARELLG